MFDNIEINRRIELEKMIEENAIQFPLFHEEWVYLTKAKKLPFLDMVNAITYYKKHWFIINQQSFHKKLMIKYNVKEYELEQRFQDVYSILKYQNNVLKKDLKTQKKMIKRMNYPL